MYNSINMNSGLHDLESNGSQNIHVLEQVIKCAGDNYVPHLFLQCIFTTATAWECNYCVLGAPAGNNFPSSNKLNKFLFFYAFYR